MLVCSEARITNCCMYVQWVWDESWCDYLPCVVDYKCHSQANVTHPCHQTFPPSGSNCQTFPPSGSNLMLQDICSAIVCIVSLPGLPFLVAVCLPHSNPNHCITIVPTLHTVFLRSDAVATIFFAARFCAATIRGWRLSLWKACGHQWLLDKVRTVTTVAHCH